MFGEIDDIFLALHVLGELLVAVIPGHVERNEFKLSIQFLGQ